MKLAHSIDWPEEYKRGLVVVAHADDAEYGCSGTVARLVAEGWDMAYVVCTDGSKGSSEPDITEAQLSELRREEQENAGKILSNVNKKLDYLVIGEKPTIKKVKQAKELNIKVIKQSEWEKLLN